MMAGRNGNGRLPAGIAVVGGPGGGMPRELAEVLAGLGGGRPQSEEERRAGAQAHYDEATAMMLKVCEAHQGVQEPLEALIRGCWDVSVLPEGARAGFVRALATATLHDAKANPAEGGGTVTAIAGLLADDGHAVYQAMLMAGAMWRLATVPGAMDGAGDEETPRPNPTGQYL